MSAETSAGTARNDVDLVAILAQHGDSVTESAEWPMLRAGLFDLVERVVVNDEVRGRHLLDIRRRKIQRTTFARRLDLAKLAGLRDRGVRHLSDLELISLALDPVTLGRLAESLRDVMPDAWRDAHVRDGRLLYQEHGRVPPDIDDLIRRARARGLADSIRNRNTGGSRRTSTT